VNDGIITAVYQLRKNIAPPKAFVNKGFAQGLNLVCDKVCEIISNKLL